MKKFIALLVVAGVVCFGWYKVSLRPVDADSQSRQKIVIEPGTSVQAIAGVLEEKGLVRSATAFTWYVRLNGKTQALQAGTFVLQPSSSVPELVESLRVGKSEEISLTIPEGFTVREIDALLAEKGVMEAGEIINCLQTCDFSSFDWLPDSTELADRGGRIEGYLFADTYFVNVEEFVPKFFLERLMTTFKNRIIEGYADGIAASGRPLHELVTMASLVEKETRTAEERPVVAGILWKRYDAGVGLGVDATVRYITNKPTEAITVTDLAVDSPYNTRRFAGLPPGPIATFSEKTFEATLNPEESPHWYYLHAPDGQIHYAETNDGHNANKARYLR